MTILNWSKKWKLRGIDLSVGWMMIIIIIISSCLYRSTATDIKWTPNNNNMDGNEAATAPRSQRYWDEHNIERPDYAKTDWEIAQENLLKTKESILSPPFLILLLILFILVVVIVAIRHPKKKKGKGYFHTVFTATNTKYTTTKTKEDGKHSSEELRRARLAKLDSLNRSSIQNDPNTTSKND